MVRWLVWLPGMSDLWRYQQMGITDAVVNQAFNPNMALLQAMDQFYRAGMKVWRYPAEVMVPAGVPELDQHPAFAGISIKDEPVMHGMNPQQWQAQADSFRKMIGQFPVLGNLEGDKFSARVGKLGLSQQKTLGEYLAVPDITLYDFYGESRCRYHPDKSFIGWYGLEAGLNSFRQMIIMARDFLVPRRLGVVVEMSNQCIDKNSRASTRGEFRARLWSHFLLGARDFMIFPQRPNNVKDPETGNPIWETFGTANCAIPPELELEFYQNKRLLEIADSWGVPTSKVDSPGLISASWADGHIITLEMATQLVTCSLNGGIQWELTGLSSPRKYSPFVYPEQTTAQALLDSLRAGSDLVKLKEQNVKLQNRLDRIREIFEED